MLPFEIKAMILRYAVNSILEDLRRTDTEVPYNVRLRQYLSLRLTSKSFNEILSQQLFEGQTLDLLLRRKQLEKLDFVLEALQMTADFPPHNSRLSVPKLKRMCGKFWHNPDLTLSTVSTAAVLLSLPQNLNFAAKLEPWIMRHRTRSTFTSVSEGRILVFEAGDWVINESGLRIRKVSNWNPKPRSKMGIYLTHEAGHLVSSVHTRLGNERRWYVEVFGIGRPRLKCLVNFGTKMVWDNLVEALYDFDGRLYRFNGGNSDDDEDDHDEEGSEDGSTASEDDSEEE
jgi:hypothetical protein